MIRHQPAVKIIGAFFLADAITKAGILHIKYIMTQNKEILIKWPELPFAECKNTFYTVQLWTQIVGKIRLVKMPWLNHSWHVTLYISPRGLSTGSIPYEHGLFRIEFDFIDHELTVLSSSGTSGKMDLYPRTVSSFYRELFSMLTEMGIPVIIHAVPNELDPAIPFELDELHQSYDEDQINRLWRVLVQVDTVFTKFRARFNGKCSPVHFFWGAFDLAVTRFSGRPAPRHPGGMPNMPLSVMQEAYSHEVSSCGFWPGNDQFPHAAFYSYCYPTPSSFGEQKVLPKEAFYSKEMGEYFLLYDTVRQSSDPEQTLMEFLQSTYEAAANTGNWDRKALEFDFKKG